MIKNHSFRKQFENKGCYAEITFEVAKMEGSSSNLEIKYLADPRWETASRAGVLIFHDYYIRKMCGDLQVTILDMKWLPVDTNNLIIVFAMIEALCAELNLHAENLFFDSTNGIFHFPEVRSIH